MKNNMLPKPGTTLSVEWEDNGPLLHIEGAGPDLAISLAFLAGALETRCDFPRTSIELAAEHSKELYEGMTRNSVVVDLSEAARQAAQMKKGENECASES